MAHQEGWGWGVGRGVVDPVGNVPLSLFPMSQPFEIRSC